MDRQADGFGLVGEGAADGLLNPPGTVGAEFGAAVGIEALHRLHQADIAFADEIEQGKA